MVVEVNTLFTIGNILLLFASFPLLYTVWHNRETLKGFNPYGTTLTFVALLVFNWAYFVMDNWWSIAVSATTVAFWGLATVYSWRN